MEAALKAGMSVPAQCCCKWRFCLPVSSAAIIPDACGQHKPEHVSVPPKCAAAVAAVLSVHISEIVVQLMSSMLAIASQRLLRAYYGPLHGHQKGRHAATFSPKLSIPANTADG